MFNCELGDVIINNEYYCLDDLNVLDDIIDLYGISTFSSNIDDQDDDGLNDNQDDRFAALELGHQVWENGRLVSLSFMASGIYESYGYHIPYLPESISDLVFLNYLNVSETGLVSFPDSFGNLPSLDALDAWRNELNDNSFPNSMNNLSLSGISLDGNYIQTFPNFIQYSTPQLSYLYLGYGFWGTGNQIEYLPDWWSYTEIPFLQLLDLSNNNLIELPEDINAYPFELMLWNNQLTNINADWSCLLYTSPSPRDLSTSRMPSSA